MITNVIVLTSLLLVGIYGLLWLFRSDLRQRIEQPKYRFQQQVSDFDNQVNGPETAGHGHSGKGERTP